MGNVVGHTTIGGAHNAFIWNQYTGMLNLNAAIETDYPGWTLLEAYDINENGWIVGLGVSPDGAQQGFLLQPVPLPASLWLFISGCLIIFRIPLRSNFGGLNKHFRDQYRSAAALVDNSTLAPSVNP